MNQSANDQSTAKEQSRRERNARRTWVTIVVGLLGLQVVGGIATVVLATGDPTVAIIPNYHQSAVNWDTTRRALQLTEQLQWTVNSTVGPTVSGAQGSPTRRQLRVEITSPSGQAIANLNLGAKLYHHALGTEIHNLMLQEVADGIYVGDTSLTQSGMWQVKLQIEGEHGIAASSQEIKVK